MSDFDLQQNIDEWIQDNIDSYLLKNVLTAISFDESCPITQEHITALLKEILSGDLISIIIKFFMSLTQVGALGLTEQDLFLAFLDGAQEYGAKEDLIEKLILSKDLDLVEIFSKNGLCVPSLRFHGTSSSQGRSESQADYSGEDLDEDGLLDFPGRYESRMIDRFIEALVGQESGNNYSATNDYGAYGRYQIMWYNAIPWALDATGMDYTSRMNRQDKNRFSQISAMKEGKTAKQLRGINHSTNPSKNVNEEAVEILLRSGVYENDVQDDMAKKKIESYFSQTDDWAIVAAMWYCGESRNTIQKALECRSGDPRYPDAKQYMNSILSKLKGLTAQAMTTDNFIKITCLKGFVKKSNMFDMMGDIKSADKLDKIIEKF